MAETEEPVGDEVEMEMLAVLPMAGAHHQQGDQRHDLEVRAQLLRDTSLSADLLEERARSLLGFADPRDYVIRLKP